MKVGDCVQLKSGGPKMAMGEDYMKGTRCQWFAGDVLKEGDFPLAALQPFEEEKVPEIKVAFIHPTTDLADAISEVVDEVEPQGVRERIQNILSNFYESRP